MVGTSPIGDLVVFLSGDNMLVGGSDNDCDCALGE